MAGNAISGLRSVVLRETQECNLEGKYSKGGRGKKASKTYVLGILQHQRNSYFWDKDSELCFQCFEIPTTLVPFGRQYSFLRRPWQIFLNLKTYLCKVITANHSMFLPLVCQICSKLLKMSVWYYYCCSCLELWQALDILSIWTLLYPPLNWRNKILHIQFKSCKLSDITSFSP